MEEVCKELDGVLLEVMSSLQELSQLRERYSVAVKEVKLYRNFQCLSSYSLFCVHIATALPV